VNVPPMGAPVPEGKVSYFFSGSESSSGALLFIGKADAAALSDADWEASKSLTDVHRRAFKIIYKSAAYPRTLELVSPRLSPVQRERLASMLMSSPEDPAAVDALSRYHGTTGFSPLGVEEHNALSRIRKLRALVAK
jgi:ABC-type phosphate/phosphonate transport system substrate-binding protein